MLQVVVHVLRHQVVGDAAVDKKRWELLELGPQLPGDFDVYLCEAEPLLGVHKLWKHPRCRLRVVVSLDVARAARHLLHHGAGVQGIGVVPQDAPDKPRVLILVGADAGLARHVLAREYKRWTPDHRGLQHGVRLCVGGVKLGRLVAPARLQRLAQDVLLGYARKGDSVLEDVHPKAGVELLHLLQRLKERSDVQVVVVLQPVTEGLHATLSEDTMAVVVLLKREYVLTLELRIPSHVGGEGRGSPACPGCRTTRTGARTWSRWPRRS